MKRIINNKYIILLPIFFLNIISLTYLYQTSYFLKQLIFLILSYLLLYIFSKIKLNKIFKYIGKLYIISIILLTLVLIIGKEINGSKAWLKIFNISIQPSEITKLVLSLYLPYLIIKKKKIILILLIILVPSLLTYLEPDTGAIIIYLIILLSTLKHLKIKKKIYLNTIIVITILLFINIYIYLNNQDLFLKIYGNKIYYRLDRLISFKEQNNIQTTNSLISIGAHKLLYIPENHNDFIFASIISLYNPLITILVLLSYLSIFLYYLKNIKQKKNISNIYNQIILNTLLFQTFYNILMNLSLVPIIGIPLPFLSYGGSYLITLYILIGISINLINKNKDNYMMDNYT